LFYRYTKQEGALQDNKSAHAMVGTYLLKENKFYWYGTVKDGQGRQEHSRIFLKRACQNFKNGFC
jgi:hypothetical protein